jgi:hypothetical protein
MSSVNLVSQLGIDAAGFQACLDGRRFQKRTLQNRERDAIDRPASGAGPGNR